MAGNVEGQRNCYANHPGNTFQTVIDIVASVAVSASLVESGIADDGQQVVAFVFGVLVENHLHLLGPFDDELLTGLATSIGNIAVFKVSLFQKSHVDEAHSSEIKAHKEHIAGVVECRSQGQVQCLDLLDDSQRQGAFDSLVNAGIDMAERIAVLDDVILDRTVIDSSEYAGVKGDCIRSDTSILVPCFISLHCFRGNAVEHNVLVFTKLLEAVESRFVGLGGSYLAVMFQLGDDAFHEVEQRVFMRIAVELVDHVVGRVYQTVGIQLAVNLGQPLDVPSDTLTD